MLRGTINSPEELGRMLQQGRLLKGLTQREMASELNVSQRYIHEMESGKPTLYADRLFDFIRATGLTFVVEIDEGDEATGSAGSAEGVQSAETAESAERHG